MVASAEAADSAPLRTLFILGLLHADQSLLEDVFLLRKLLCVCLMHKSSILFMGTPNENVGGAWAISDTEL